MNFFFDLINDCAGYNEKDANGSNSTTMSRDSAAKNMQSLVDSTGAVNERHPHCLLVVQGAEKLYRMFRPLTKQHLSVDYLDSLILRLKVSSIPYN